MTDLNFTGTPEQGTSSENGFNWLALVSEISRQQTTPSQRPRDGRRLNDIRLLLTRPGTPITKIYGRMRVGGQLIWNGALREHISQTGGDKGAGPSASGRQRQFHYSMHLAIGLCGREISSLGRIWADGQLLDTSRVSMTLYHGTQTQEVDPLIEADMGVGRTPAYRGLAYVVMKDFDLTAYGNRVPQLSFEVFAPVDNHSDMVRAVALLPGASEFGYHPDPHIQLLGIGRAGSENVNAHAGLSDWDLSLNDLQDTHSGCRQVALVVAWFGTDLRANMCRLEPRVENKTKDTLPSQWSVAGLTRGTANVVSYVNGRPAFGGTPSDASVLAAIDDLKQRGFEVLFYPFIMMDIAADNELPNPDDDGWQPAYPWRGRITCDPAPGQAGSPHGTSAIGDIIDSFVKGDSADDVFCLRGMVRHYAELCAQAGGVDGFLLGSELRGLSGLRASDTDYPFATALVDLAQQVREILPETKISYAADWSEYGAGVEANGFVGFPLDAFWSHEDCDFIAIDAYFPLSDWRDGQTHLDAQSGVTAITDNDYLQRNIEGGEYYDWYYRHAAARDAQDRSVISDGADNAEVWMYRAKDIHGWWSNQHRPRLQNMSQAATGWVPQSKPIWFSEIGCPAVDKGSNQPNVFPDHLSSEAAVPYFSNGQRDDHIQRAYLAAFTAYYRQTAHNPTSSVYGQPMVASDKMFIWAWDARPFPAFPYRTDVWADGPNWHTGHWINGRSATAPLALLLDELAREADQLSDICEIEGVVEGFAVQGTVSARDALAPLVSSFAIDVLTGRSRLKFFGRANKPVCQIDPDDIIWQGQNTSLRYHHPNEAALPTRLDLHYIDAENDYGPQCVSAHYLGGERPIISLSLPIALSSYTAQSLAARLLHETRQAAETMSVRLSPAYIELEPGDVIELEQKQWRVTEVSLAGHVGLTATRHQAGLYQPQLAGPRTAAAPPTLGLVSRPALQLLDLPARLPLKTQPSNEAGQPLLASFADPWPGDVQILDQNGDYLQSLLYPASMGQTKSRLAAGPIGRWDVGGRLQVEMHGANLSSLTRQQVLQGGNVVAVQTELGWEVMQFVQADLIAPNQYVLSEFLRGQNGSEAVMVDALEAGAAVVLLTPQLPPLEVAPTQLAAETSLHYGPGALPRESYGWQSNVFATKRVGLTCLAPAHMCQRTGENGDIEVTWIRRSRLGGDDFEAAEIPLGEVSEAYQISVVADDETIYQSQTNAAHWTYEASLRAQHLAAYEPQHWHIGVAQISATQGAGYPSRISIN